MRILDIHPFSGGQWKIYVFTKTPLVDENKIVIGTIFNGMDISNTTTMEIGALLSKVAVDATHQTLLSQNSYAIGFHPQDIHLSERQNEVLFYLLRGKTVKQIARILSLSNRTVDDHLEQLRSKFQADTKHELIDKAISLNYLNVIPERLFRKQLSVELRD